MGIFFTIVGILFGGGADFTTLGMSAVMAVEFIVFGICWEIAVFLISMAALITGKAVEKKGRAVIVVVFLLVVGLYAYLYFADPSDTGLLTEFLQAFAE